MKDLLKASPLEKAYSKLTLRSEAVCDSDCACNPHRNICNKYCREGASNYLPTEETDILF